MTQLEFIKSKYGEDLLFVGYRGSYCLGIDMPSSDRDYLVIVDYETTKCKELQNDTTVYGINLAHERILNGSFNFVEALLAPVFVSENFPYEKYIDIFDSSEYEACFIYHVWGYIKNLLKLYDKKEDKRKWAAKIILYYKLIMEYDKMLDFFKVHKLPEELEDLYFRIRTSELTDDDVLLIEQIREWRNSELVKRAIKDEASYSEYLIKHWYRKQD